LNGQSGGGKKRESMFKRDSLCWLRVYRVQVAAALEGRGRGRGGNDFESKSAAGEKGGIARGAS